MGKFFPVLLAFILNCSGIYIFRTPDNSNCFPYVSYVIFLLSIFYLLWDVPLNPYPACFRKIAFWASFIVEFIVTALIMELIMSDFWLPLEEKFVAFPATSVDNLDRYLRKHSIRVSALYDMSQFLKSQQALLGLSYLLSIFFLACMMHSTRIIDFGLLKCGVGPFVEDIRSRLMRFVMSFVKAKSKACRKSPTPERCSKPPRKRRCKKGREVDWEESSFDTFDTDSRSSFNSQAH